MPTDRAGQENGLINTNMTIGRPRSEGPFGENNQRIFGLDSSGAGWVTLGRRKRRALRRLISQHFLEFPDRLEIFRLLDSVF